MTYTLHFSALVHIRYDKKNAGPAFHFRVDILKAKYITSTTRRKVINNNFGFCICRLTINLNNIYVTYYNEVT